MLLLQRVVSLRRYRAVGGQGHSQVQPLLVGVVFYELQSLGECLERVLSVGFGEVLWKLSTFAVLLDDAEQLGDCIGQSLLDVDGLSEEDVGILPRKVVRKLLVQPHFDSVIRRESDHLICDHNGSVEVGDSSVPHSSFSQDVEYFSEREVVHLRQSAGKPLQPHSQELLALAHVLVVLVLDVVDSD